MTSINSKEDLLRALAENPQWREAVRAHILGEELLQLPAKFSTVLELMSTFVKDMHEFVSNIRTFVVDQRTINAEMQEFKSDQLQFNSEMREFKTAQLEFNTRQEELSAGIIRRVDNLIDEVDVLKGYRILDAATANCIDITEDMGFTYSKTLTRADKRRMAQGAAGSGIPTNELRSFRLADLLIEATDGENTHYIAVEASFTADGRDTTRALRNARFLTQFTGCPSHAAIVSVRNDHQVTSEIESGAVFWYEMEDRSPNGQ